MLKKILTGAVAATVLAGSAGVASAAPQWQHRDNSRYDQRYDHRGDYGSRYDRRDRHQIRHWRRGERLPAQYRTSGYYVDYRSHRLPPPPRGYRYYRSGNDVVLGAIATGIIASVIINAMN